MAMIDCLGDTGAKLGDALRQYSDTALAIRPIAMGDIEQDLFQAILLQRPGQSGWLVIEQADVFNRIKACRFGRRKAI